MNAYQKKSIFRVFWAAGVVAAALLLTTPALADDSTLPEPPQEPEAAEAAPVTDETQDASTAETPAEAVTEEALPDLPLEEEAGGAAAGGETTTPDEAASSEENLTEVIEAASAEGLELADASGELLVLSESSSSEAILDGDPYFMVGTTMYSFTTTDCDPDTPGNQGCANPLQAAVNYIRDHGTVPTDRKIYVESGSYIGATIDGASFPVLSQLNGVIGAGSGASTLTSSLMVWSPAAGFTVKGFTINGQLSIQNAIGNVLLEDLDVQAVSTGISVLTAGSIELKNVESSWNSGKGAILENYGSPTYKVTVSNSEFDDNNAGYNTGALEIRTNGAVTLNGVSASRNRGDGADIATGFTSLTVKNSYFSDNYQSPDDFWGYGLWAWNDSPGPVTLENVTAVGNEHTNIFLHVDGNVKATNVETRWSATGGGFVVDTSFSPSLRTVQITNGTFGDNSVDGLAIETTGSVTLKNVTANNNAWGYGAYIDNCLDTGGGDCAGKGSVTITGVLQNSLINDFSLNGLTGLMIQSRGTVTVSNLDAYGNGYHGVEIDTAFNGTTAGVTVNSTLSGAWINWLGNNANNGLLVSSWGNIVVADTAAMDNNANGMMLSNIFGTGKSIQVRNSQANGNVEHGLLAQASGAITLQKNTTFNENGFYSGADGAWLTTYSGNISIYGISADEPTEFSGNQGNGLNVSSGGATIIKNVSAEYNEGPNGIHVLSMAYGKPTSLTNTSFSNNQNGLGLWVEVMGPVTLDTVAGNWNGYYGAYIDNCWEVLGSCNGTGNVTVKAKSGYTNEFSNNYNDSGLAIYSKGTISLTNVTADYNQDGNGAFLMNAFLNATGGITVKATNDQFNSFSLYQAVGLYAESNGTISISRVIANYNKSYGAHLLNLTSVTPKTIAISDSTFNYNQDDGLLAQASGAIKVNGAQAHQNSLQTGILNESGTTLYEFIPEDYLGPDGEYWYSDDYWRFDGTSGFSTTITLSSEDFTPIFSVYSSGYGWIVNENNPGNLSSVSNTFVLPGTATYWIYVYPKNNIPRGNYTLSLNDPSESSPWTPEVSGLALFSNIGGVTIGNSKTMGFGADTYNNAFDGVHIDAAGSVKTSYVYANMNGNRGLSINNTLAASSGVTINNAYLDDNYTVGTVVNTNGAIKWTNGSANFNRHEGGAGLLVSTNPGSVTLSNVELNHNNGTSGLFIWTAGAVNLTNVDASHTSGSNGVLIFNHIGIAPVTVKSSGKGQVCEFSHNDDRGLEIHTNGNIFLSGVDASNNGSIGAWMDSTGSSGTPYVKISNGSFNNNNDVGLSVDTKGLVTLTNVDASGNSLQGGWLDINSHGQTQGEHLGQFNEFDEWWFHVTSGVPVLIEVDSIDFSPELDVYSYDGYWYGSASGGGGTQAQYTLSLGWSGNFYVVVQGGNGYYDISLNDTPNTYSSSVPYIMGANINNCQNTGAGCTGTGSVTIGGNTDNEFSGNNGTGLYVITSSTINATNVSASTNGDDGVYFDANNSGTGTVQVKNTLKGGRSFFNENTSDGLIIYANGNVTLNKIAAFSNADYGAYIFNWDANLKNGLTANDVRFSNNGVSGLMDYGSGVVNITNIYANGNGVTGFHIINSDAQIPQAVTIKKVYASGNQASHGFLAISTGQITVDAVYATGNAGSGFFLRNNFIGASGGITISGVMGSNYVGSNNEHGFYAESAGPINVSRVTAAWNAWAGVCVDNSTGSGNLTMNNVTAAYNGDTGVFAGMNGAISLNAVTALSNGETFNGDGIWLITGAFPVTIKNSTSIGNWGSGIEIDLAAPYWPTLSNTNYMGNDVNNTGDANLYIYY